MRRLVALVIGLVLPGAAVAPAWEFCGLAGDRVTGLQGDVESIGLYASTGDRAVYASRDSTTTWVAWNDGLGDSAVVALGGIAPFGRGTCPYMLLYAGTPSGVWTRWTEDPDMVTASGIQRAKAWPISR